MVKPLPVLEKGDPVDDDGVGGDDILSKNLAIRRNSFYGDNSTMRNVL